MKYRAMSLDDYSELMELWAGIEGVRLRDVDSYQGIKKYLGRNPGLSFVAVDGNQVVGTIMAGHDGRRGYIQHLAVAEAYRRSGIASELVRRCLEALEHEGIAKSHLMILAANQTGKRFWESLGWRCREDVELYSFINGTGEST